MDEAVTGTPRRETRGIALIYQGVHDCSFDRQRGGYRSNVPCSAVDRRIYTHHFPGPRSGASTHEPAQQPPLHGASALPGELAHFPPSGVFVHPVVFICLNKFVEPVTGTASTIMLDSDVAEGPQMMLLIDTVEIEHVAADMVTLNAAPPLATASYRCPPLLVSVAPLAAPRVQPPDT